MTDSRTSMKAKISTQQQILGIIVVIILLVGTIGVYTYSQFSDVVNKVSETTAQDPAISKTRKILFDISLAENQIRRYTLTEDTLHLQKFNEIRAEVDTLLTELVQLEPISNEFIEIDTFRVLTENRFDILNEIALTQDAFRVEEAFKNVSASIATVNETSDEPKKSKSWIKRLTRKDKVQSTLDLTKMNENIRLVQEKETLKEENQVDSELELLKADNKNALALQAIVDDLALSETTNARKKVAEVGALVERTNTQVILFCAVICLLLILTSITIINYIRRNSAFRLMLSRAKTEAESLAKAKALFVATVSHEIRTPINIIAGFSEQLHDSELTPEQRDQLKGIEQSSAHLLDLVNAVLDFSKLENNRIEIESKHFEPSELISTLSSLLSKIASENDVKIKFNLDESVPSILKGDPFRLRQILLNLVGNAIKFSRGGKVEISLAGIQSSDATILLNLTVRDNGIGMTPEQLETVFDEFVQANTSTTRLFGGTGLGLPITKKLIELQGGTIEMESEEGIGTTVHVVIPLQLGNPEELESHIEGIEQIDLRTKKILVVDDEPFNRKLIRTILAKQNASVIEATNGREAIAAAESQTFDLILMDIQMPLVDGIEASLTIRETNPTVPIVALTAALSADELERYSQAGMNGHLGKPFKQAHLLQTIAGLLSLPVVVSETSKKQIIQVGQQEDKIGFDDLKQLSDGDTAFYIEMLETFEKSTRDGIQAIQVAINHSNWKQAGELAHRICAPCKHLSANSLYRYLKRIEENCLHEENLEEMPILLEYILKESSRVLSLIEKERLAVVK